MCRVVWYNVNCVEHGCKRMWLRPSVVVVESRVVWYSVNCVEHGCKRSG